MNLVRAGIVLTAIFRLAGAQTVTAARPKFEVASVRPCTDSGGAFPGGRKGGGVRSSPGSLDIGCQTLEDLIRFAYLGYPDGFPRVSTRILFQPIRGAPAWAGSERYTIEAKAETPQTMETMRGPMMQTLLEDRFRLRVRLEKGDMPVYFLTVGKGGPKLRTARQGSCIPFDFGHPPAAPRQPVCGMFRPGRNGEGVDTYGQTIAGLCEQFSAGLDRDVIDKTGVTGKFDIHLDLSSADLCSGCATPDSPVPAAASDAFGAISAAVRELGLKLEASKAPAEFVVIDHVERPGEN